MLMRFLEWLNLQLQRQQCLALPDGEAGGMKGVAVDHSVDHVTTFSTVLTM